MPCLYEPTYYISRAGFLLLTFVSLILSTFIYTKICDTFQVPYYEPQIQTIQEIVDYGFTLVGDQLVLTKMSQENEVKGLNFAYTHGNLSASFVDLSSGIIENIKIG